MLRTPAGAMVGDNIELDAQIANIPNNAMYLEIFASMYGYVQIHLIIQPFSVSSGLSIFVQYNMVGGFTNVATSFEMNAV